jgi:hypothetical protein
VLALLLVACSEASPAPDAALPDAGLPDVDPLDPIAAATPVLACAPGWTAVAAGDVERCAPFGGGTPARCGDLEMQLPSSTACAPVGAPCLDVPPAPATGRAIYVAPGGDGDGSMSAPFGRIADAIAASASGDAVLLLPGTYGESLRVDRGISIRGACPERTRIAGTGTAVEIAAEGVVLSDLAVSGDGDGVVVREGDATLKRVVLVDLPQRSLVIGARATVRDSLLVVRDAATGVGTSRGIEVIAGGAATIERSVIRGHHDLSASVVGSLEASDSVFWDRSGFNTFVLGPTTLRRCVVAGADPGLVAFTAASVLVVEDSELRGVGLVVNDDARATFERSAIVAAPNSVDVGAGTLALRDAVIADSMSTGVRLFRGSPARRERARIARWRRSGVYLDASTAVLTDVELAGDGPGFVPAAGSAPVALELREAATANVERLRVRSSVVYGVAAAEGSAIRGSHLIVEGGVTEPAGGGAALLCLRCTVDLERVLLADNAGHGVIAGLVGADVRLRELEIARTPPGLCLDESCGAFEAGVGLGSYAGAAVRAERFRFADNALMGAQVARGAEIFGGTEVGGELDLSDGTIERNPMGINVQLADYDFDRLTTRVVFRDNGQSILGSTGEPVPSPPPLGPLLEP